MILAILLASATATTFFRSPRQHRYKVVWQMTRSRNYGSCPVDQQGAEIDVAPLADAAQFDFAAGAALSRHKSKIGCKFSSGLEGAGIPNDGDCGSGCQQANPRDVGDTAARFVTAAPFHNALLNPLDLLVEREQPR